VDIARQQSLHVGPIPAEQTLHPFGEWVQGLTLDRIPVEIDSQEH